jgi:hypothetical protein
LKSCKTCGRMIYWGIDPDGRNVPLDTEHGVYSIEGDVVGGLAIRRLDRTEAMAAHWCRGRVGDDPDNKTA